MGLGLGLGLGLNGEASRLLWCTDHQRCPLSSSRCAVTWFGSVLRYA